MPVDANIALGVRAPSALPNLQDLALQHAQVMNYMSEMATRNRALMEQRNMAAVVRRPGFDPENPQHQQEILRAAPNLGPAAIQKFGELKKQRIENETAAIGLQQTRQLQAIKQLSGMTDPTHARELLEQSKAKGDLSPEAADAIENQIPATAGEMPAFVQKMIYRLVSQTKPEDAGAVQTSTVNTGQQTSVIQSMTHAGSGVAPVVAGAFQNTATPGEVLSAATTRRGQDVSANTAAQQRVAGQLEAQAKLEAWKPLPSNPDILYNDAGQFRYATLASGTIPTVSVFGPVPSNAMAPTGSIPANAMAVPRTPSGTREPTPVVNPAPPSLGGVPTPEPAPTSLTGAPPITTQGLEGKTLPEVQSAMSARRSLATVGYGSQSFNDIPNLIRQSTNGQLNKSVNDLLSAGGQTSDSAAALQQLSTYVGPIILGLTNGKLGAGISDADVKLLSSSLGDVANPTLSTSTRLAAWDRYVKNTARVANYPAPEATSGAMGDNVVEFVRDANGNIVPKK